MANVKIPDLTAYANPAGTDVLVIVDVGADVTKKVSVANLLKNAPAGTAAAPGIAFGGDSDTGIYSPGGDQLALSTNGTGRLFVDNAGNVGIGTSSPTANLEVEKSTSGSLEIGNTVGQRVRIEGGSSGISMSTPNALNMTFGTNNTERLRITSAGLVGIGTSSPVGPFHLVGDTSADASAEYSILNVSDTSDTTKALRLAYDDVNDCGVVSASDRGTAWKNVAISPSGGKVGIGTTSPGVELHVDGDIRCDGVYGETDTNTSIQFPGSDVITFNEGGSEAARIDSSGRLLVGTPTARSNFFNGIQTSKFQVEGTDISTGAAAIIRNSDNTGGPMLHFAKSRGTTVGSNTLAQADDAAGLIAFSASDGSEFVSTAYISSAVDGTPGADDMPGRLMFSVTADGAASPTEAMRIKNTRVINFSNAPVYADNAAAKTGGLVDGDVYRTSTGDLKIVYT